MQQTPTGPTWAKNADSFDHLVGAGEQHRGHVNAEGAMTVRNIAAASEVVLYDVRNGSVEPYSL